MEKLTSPFYPIIYVRGYAMTQSEINETVSTPYMGFNLGSTKIRKKWDGEVYRHIFESPLLRLIKDYQYQDIYSEGAEITTAIPPRSVIVYRYYEIADKDLGNGKVQSIIEAARGLKKLIHDVKNQVCIDHGNHDDFKVHLVAHSMGGLVCRAFLQNDDISDESDRALVDKLFTYATPHNGIEMAGFNVPGFLGLWDLNNFNRDKMIKYLDLPEGAKRVDSLNGKFDPEKVFCFVGTNSKDYDVASGISSKLAGEMSDGLVRIENATVQGAPRAFAYRSHSGHYGVVNSEEGYQNLVRFLFGDFYVHGVIESENLPLPPSVQKAKDNGKEVRASYYFETTVVTRGLRGVALTERRKDTFSAIFRKYEQLFPGDGSAGRSPVLFSTFLDTRKIEHGRTIVFKVSIAVSSTGYSIAGKFWNQNIDGDYLYDRKITIKATKTSDGWNLRYLEDDRWSDSLGTLIEQINGVYRIPLSSRKGYRGFLNLTVGNVE